MPDTYVGQRSPESLFEDKKRPIKVSLTNDRDKSIVLKSLAVLKNNPWYIGMSITEDLTIAERANLKEWEEKRLPNSTGGIKICLEGSR